MEDKNILSDAEMKQALAFSKQIDVNKNQIVVNYGAGSLAKVSKYASQLRRQLESQRDELAANSKDLDRLETQNIYNQKEVYMYIVAGKTALEQAKGKDLIKLQEKAFKYKSEENTKALNDYMTNLDHLEKQIQSLEMSYELVEGLGDLMVKLKDLQQEIADRIQNALIDQAGIFAKSDALPIVSKRVKVDERSIKPTDDMTQELLRKNKSLLNELYKK